MRRLQSTRSRDVGETTDMRSVPNRAIWEGKAIHHRTLISSSMTLKDIEDSIVAAFSFYAPV